MKKVLLAAALFLTSCLFLSAGISVADGPPAMVRLSGGTFWMGSPEAEAERGSEEFQHQVSVGPYYISVTEVTQKLWSRVMGTKPSSFKDDLNPVENVSWFDAVKFCNQLSAIEGYQAVYTISGTAVSMNRLANGYRLPTEAEWEYAARAGLQSPFSTGDAITAAQANFNGLYPYKNGPVGENRSKTTSVGSFPANGWGIYDMHGNVWEWCWDWFADYDINVTKDPEGAAAGMGRVLRGGSWMLGGGSVRSSVRNFESPDFQGNYIGFRIARSDVQKAAVASGTVKMIPVLGGSFDMGSPSTEANRANDETVHRVKVASFEMMTTHVSVANFRAFVNATGYKTSAELLGTSWTFSTEWVQTSGAYWDKPGYTQTENHPVANISWYDAVIFANWLSEKDGRSPAYSYKGSTSYKTWASGWNTTTHSDISCNYSATGYRLPTEAEYEYAARGGTKASVSYVSFAGLGSIDSNAWYNRMGGDSAKAMATKAPNSLGLYDMSGNLWQWCNDIYQENITSLTDNPRGASSGSKRLLKGGAWNNGISYIRVAYRHKNEPWHSAADGGFRLVVMSK